MTHGKSLGQVMEDMMRERTVPDTGLLERYIKTYPQFAEPLAEFAGEWLLIQAAPTQPPDTVKAEDAPSIDTAMARMKARIRELDPTSAQLDDGIVDPFAGRAAAWLKETGRSLDLDTTIMAKLKHRLILVSTIPKQLMEGLAGRLDVTVADFSAWLEAPPKLNHAHFKSSGKPANVGRESFTQAVRQSTLDDPLKARWLADEKQATDQQKP